MTERRVTGLLPRALKTDHNERLLGPTADPLFEPDAFELVEGRIGDPSGVPADDLARTPFISESTQLRTDHQLSVAVAKRSNPDDPSSAVTASVFYDDIISHISVEGGIVTDESRLFSTGWHAWTPPIDYDMWTNHANYFWCGEGTAALNGEYITKEARGQRTVFREVSGTTTVERIATHESVAVGSWSSGTTGEVRIDCSVAGRRPYQWNGSTWVYKDWIAIDDDPNEVSTYPQGTLLYVARYGYQYQRVVLHRWSDVAGRWVSHLPVIGLKAPDNPVDGTIWEDCTSAPDKVFRRYDATSGAWASVTPTVVSTLVGQGVGSDGDLIIEVEEVTNVDDWSENNWWKHYEDLNTADRADVVSDQAVRPILCIWGGIEKKAGDTRSARHDQPEFKVYTWDSGTSAMVYQDDSTVIQFKPGSGIDDSVLGFAVSQDSLGEYIFQVTLESDTISGALGYRHYKDEWSGLFKSLWVKSLTDATQTLQQTGTYDIPLGIRRNPDHITTSEFSRANILNHMVSVIGSNSSGQSLGNNGWRWSDQDATSGATAVDPEDALLRTGVLLLDTKLSLPEAIRKMGNEYQRFERKFKDELTKVWNAGTYSDPDDTLKSGTTAADVVDAVLSTVLAGRVENGVFWGSDMGTYTSSIIGASQPIAIPNSPARVGAVPSHTPRVLGTKIITHDGRTTAAYGDDRDLVLVELETRFHNEVPTVRKTETTTQSVFLDEAGWTLRYYVANWIPVITFTTAVITSDPGSEGDPGTIGDYAYSSTDGYIWRWNGTTWESVRALVEGENFYNEADSKYYAFNGHRHSEIKLHHRSGTWDYSYNDYHTIIRPEFERWQSARGSDPWDRSDYDASDEWTWNYWASGLPGNWREMYRAIYGTDRPHSAPWEIWGFSEEPDWWRTTYVPSSTATDGSPRYVSGHAMWADLVTAATPSVTIPSQYRLAATAPVPVDGSGDLQDPIAVGLVNLDSVPEHTRGDPWQYSDGGPDWEAFINSAEGSFALSLVSYLMKPARFVERLWDDFYRPIGFGSSNVWRGPFQVEASTLRRPRISDVKVHWDLDTTQSNGRAQNPGLCSWVSELVTLRGGDPATDFGDVVRSAEAMVGWRCAGYVDNSNVRVKTPSGAIVPEEDVHIVAHKSPPHTEKFHGGIIIIREANGYRIYGYDTKKSYFDIEIAAEHSFIGTVKLNEDFTAETGQTTFTLTNFNVGNGAETGTLTVLINGLKYDSGLIQSSGNTVTLNQADLEGGETVRIQLDTSQGNPTTRPRTFQAGGRLWSYLPAGSGVSDTVLYGTFYSSPEAIIQFIIDYGRKLVSDGWYYDVDSVDWVGVAQSFATWASAGRSTGEVWVETAGGSTVNKTIDEGWVDSLISSSFPGAMGIDGKPVRPSNLFVKRYDGDFKVKTKDGSDLFGVRVTVCNHEHALLVSSTTRFGDTIYDSATGERHDYLFVSLHRTVGWAGRPEAPGRILTNSGLLLPGLDKRAKDVINAYNPHAILPTDRRNSALSSYGYFRRDHFDGTSVSDGGAFSYHKGVLQKKGTPISMTAFSRSTKSGSENVSLHECWAWLTSNFGRRGDLQLVRFRVTEDELKDKIQKIDFTDTTDLEDTDIEVLPPDRSGNNTSDRWVIPPKTDNFTLPLSGGVPDTTNLFYRMRAWTEGNTSSASLFMWDPAIGAHEPVALSQIDFIGSFDPASYTSGPNSTYQETEKAWGDEQLGYLWFDQSYLEYADYRSGHHSEWGALSYTTITATTNDINVFTSTTATAHGLEVGQQAFVYDISGNQYLAAVETTPSDTSLTYVLYNENDPESVLIDVSEIDPDTFVKISDKEVVVWEWVSSDANPLEWLELDGGESGLSILNSSDPSWSHSIDEDGNITYYFWLRGGASPGTNKDMSPLEVERRLADPSSEGVAWFGIIGSQSVAFHVPGLRAANDDAVIEIEIDNPSQDAHEEWTIFPEDDPNNPVPDAVRDQILECLVGVDSIGNTLPFSVFIESEKYGTGIGQTIFQNVTQARKEFLAGLNSSLSRTKALVHANKTTALPDASEDVWWEKADYTDPDFSGASTAQVFQNATDRDTNFKFPFEDDLCVLQEGVTVGGSDVRATFQYQTTGWVEVASEDSTASILDAIWDQSNPKALIIAVLDILPTDEANNTLMNIIHEMMIQNQECWWCYKTSYVDVRLTVSIGTPVSAPRDEIPHTLAALEEVKPYRTKLRRTTTVGEVEIDESTAEIEEIIEERIVEKIDRLAEDGEDEYGWDTIGWDVKPWDAAPWAARDYGRNEWELLGTITIVSGTHTYRISGAREWTTIELRRYGSGGVPAHTLSVESTDLVVYFPSIPAAGSIFEVYQTLGTREGEASMPDEANPFTDPYTHDHDHAGVRGRSVITGTWPDTRAAQASVNTGTDERVVSDPGESLMIRMTTEDSPLFNSWDASPWDAFTWMGKYGRPTAEGVIESGEETDPEDAPTDEIDMVEAVVCGADQERTRTVAPAAINSGFFRTPGAIYSNYNGVVYYEVDTNDWEVVGEGVKINIEDEFFSYDIGNDEFTASRRIGKVYADSRLLVNVTDYSLSADRKTITMEPTVPAPASIRVVPQDPVEDGATVRICYASAFLRSSNIRITQSDISYDIDAFTHRLIQREPYSSTPGDMVTVEHQGDVRSLDNNRSFATGRTSWIDFAVTDRDDLTLAQSYFGNDRSGLKVLDLTDDAVYTSDGSGNFSKDHDVNVGQAYFSKMTGDRYRFNGSTWASDAARDDPVGFPYGVYSVRGGGHSTSAMSFASDVRTEHRGAWEMMFYPTPPFSASVIFWVSGRGGIEVDENDLITSWHDLSKTGEDAVQTTSTKRPVYDDASSTYGVESGVVFDPTGTIEYLTAGSGFDNAFAGTNNGGYLMVIITPDAGGGYVVDKTDGVDSGWHLQITDVGGNAGISFGHHFDGTDGLWTADTGILLTNPVCIEITYDASDVANDPVFRVNGAIVAPTESSTPTGTKVDDSSAALTIGGDNAETAGFTGTIHEVVLSNAAPTANDRADFFHGLADLWNGAIRT